MKRVRLTAEGRADLELLHAAVCEIAGRPVTNEEMLAAMRACRLKFGLEYDLADPDVQAEFLRALDEPDA